MPKVLDKMESFTTKGTFYEIRQADDGKTLYCTCPSWRFQRLPPKQRTCKHLKAFAAARRRKAA